MTNPITPAERGITARFAMGHTGLLSGALAIFNKYKPTLGITGAPEQVFMNHWDPANSAKDFGLRASASQAMLSAFYQGQ